MIRSKYFGLAAVAFAMLSLGACTTDSNDNNLAISGNPRLDNSTLTAGGAAVSIRGTITNDAGNISYTLKVQNSTTGADATSSFLLSYKAPTTSETSWSIGDPAQGAGTITALASAATGAYNLVISATSGTATTSATIPFTVTGGTTPITTPLTNRGVVTLGAQSASAGSFLDVTNYTAYTSGVDKPYETIDVVFGADASGVTSLLSPFAASTDGFTGMASSWTTLNKTIIVGPLSSAVSTQEAVMAAIGSATTQKVAATSGLYALKLGSSGKYAALKLTVAGAGKTATADVTVYN